MSRRILIYLLMAVLAASYGCGGNVAPDDPEQQEQTGGDGQDEGQKESGEDEGGSGEGEGGGEGEGEGGSEGEGEGGSGEDEGEGEHGGEGQDEGDEGGRTAAVEVLDPGKQPSGRQVTPGHPDMPHSVAYSEFFNDLQDDLDEFGNIDYVLSQGNGTAWPIITGEGYIRLYQGSSSSKGGSYIRIRAKNGARLESVTIGSATSTKAAWSLDGKAKKSDTVPIPAGDTLKVDIPGCTEICIWCMGTSQSERLNLNYLAVRYKGGFIKEDFREEPAEYGPLVKVPLPYKVDFEGGSFPTTDKPSYYKYGLTDGPENLMWKTWFGSFSWQNALQGEQSVQLRVYQEDTEYTQSQFGYVQTEFFLQGIKSVSFKYYMSEFWLKATISWCKFGESTWRNPARIALPSYSDRETIRDFSYILDEGRPCDAKIRIEIDPATGFPSKDHYDFLMDCFVFE